MRQEWMLGEEEFYGKFAEKKRQQEKPPERKVNRIQPLPEGQVSGRDKGSNWRMMKLKRVFEIAKEENLDVEQVALDRYGTLEEFQDALKERDALDRQKGVKRPRHEHYRPLTGSGFLAGKDAGSGRVQPSASTLNSRPNNATAATGEQIAAALEQYKESLLPDGKPVLTKDQLNMLNAKVVKARITKSSNLATLEKQLEYETSRFEQGDVEVVVKDNRRQVVESQPASQLRRETHDKQGNRIKYLDEKNETLDELVRHEKLHKEDDPALFANPDDEQSSSRQKAKTYEKYKYDNIKDQLRAEKAIEECPYCFRDGDLPSVSVVALGVKVYLALPETIEMVPYHCLLVPVQHVRATLELEDDAWDEIRNFKKCLLQMMDVQKKRVIFMEQVIHLKKHKHTVIQCIPVPMGFYADAPGYFKEAILSAEEEWQQHKKLIVTDEKRGFRRALTPKLPYFHVWLNLNGGYGHVIETPEDWVPWFGQVSRLTQQVIANVLDLPIEKWRKPRRAMPEEIQLERFKRAWKPFDWTLMLQNQDE